MKYRNIYIETVMNGFIVHIDCQRAVFQNYQAMISAIGDYYKDPEKEEKTWLDESFIYVEEPWGIPRAQEVPTSMLLGERAGSAMAQGLRID